MGFLPCGRVRMCRRLTISFVTYTQRFHKNVLSEQASSATNTHTHTYHSYTYSCARTHTHTPPSYIYLRMMCTYTHSYLHQPMNARAHTHTRFQHHVLDYALATARLKSTLKHGAAFHQHQDHFPLRPPRSRPPPPPPTQPPHKPSGHGATETRLNMWLFNLQLNKM